MVLKIGIDFGTAYSSVSYLLRNDLGSPVKTEAGYFPLSELRIVRFGSQIKADEVKTEVAWNAQLKRWVWDDEIEQSIVQGHISSQNVIRNFKLGLDTSSSHIEGIRKELDNKIRQLPAAAKVHSLDDLITEFIRLLYDATKIEIKSAYYGTSSGTNFETLGPEVVISVPATWTYQMNERMKAAAMKASIPNPEIVSEPEAAMALLRQHEPQRLVQAGWVPANAQIGPLLVCDVGGGTVDMITYTAEVISGEPLREGTRGTGGLHGSAILNHYFQEELSDIDGTQKRQILDEMPNQRKEEAWARFLEDSTKRFEQQKRSFRGPSGEGLFNEISIQVDSVRSPDCGPIREGRILLNSVRVTELFKRILDPIVDMIRNQIRSFWNNNFVLLESKEVADIFPTRSNIVSQGAIVRSMLRDCVGEKYLRCSLGWAVDEYYNPNVHTEAYDKEIHGKDKVIADHWDEADIVERRMAWAFKINQAIRPGTMSTLEGYRACNPYGDVTFEQNLYSSETTCADHIPLKGPQYNIKPVGHLEFTLSEEQRQQFQPWYENNFLGKKSKKRKRNDQAEYQAFDYKLQFLYTGSDMEYTVVVPKSGNFDRPDVNNEVYTFKANLNLDEFTDRTKERHRKTRRR